MDYYYMNLSAPCRSAMLTAKALGLDLNKKPIDLFKGEQMNPEFVALNPQHCVPTLKDGDFVLWESRAILTYLASQYGKDDSLYPKDPKKRAEVDRLLYFDMGTLYHRYGEYVYPVWFQGKPVDPDKLTKLHEALTYLDGFLAGHKYAVGDEITVADHSLAASVATIVETGISLENHNNVAAWYERCNTNMPGFDTENLTGAQEFGKGAKEKLGMSD